MNPETEYRKVEDHDNYLREMEGQLQYLLDKVIELQKQDRFTQRDADEIESALFDMRYEWTEFKLTPTSIIMEGSNE